MNDPKFGYHAICAVPLVYTVVGVASAYHAVHDKVVSVRKSIARKRRLKDPELAQLTKLSGIKS